MSFEKIEPVHITRKFEVEAMEMVIPYHSWNLGELKAQNIEEARLKARKKFPGYGSHWFFVKEKSA